MLSSPPNNRWPRLRSSCMLLLRSGFGASGLSTGLGESRSVEGESALPVDNLWRFVGWGEGERWRFFVGGESDGGSCCVVTGGAIVLDFTVRYLDANDVSLKTYSANSAIMPLQ